jgi:small subunit ribosomal protein S20
LANHKSAIKRAKQNENRRLRNKAVKTETKKAVKRVRLVVAENEKDAAVEQLNTAKSIIAKAAKKGVLHRNTAARKISRLQAGVNSIS